MTPFLTQNPDLVAKFHETLMSVIQLALLALMSLIGWAVKMWISSMQSSWKQKIAARVVAFAEQRIPDGNDAKFQLAAQEISQHFPALSKDEVSHLIEEAVVNMKAKLGGKPPELPAGAPPAGMV